MKTKLNRREFMLPAMLAGLTSLILPSLRAEDAPKTHPDHPVDSAATKDFSEAADQALLAMVKRAEELHVKGVAVVAFSEGDSVNSWSSKMTVVGSMKNAPTEKSKGDNLLGIAYAKACEMADTLKDSGHAGRPTMTGEFGWQGGVIAKSKTGHLIVAFSGGPSEDDLRISRAGLEVLVQIF